MFLVAGERTDYVFISKSCKTNYTVRNGALVSIILNFDQLSCRQVPPELCSFVLFLFFLTMIAKEVLSIYLESVILIPNLLKVLQDGFVIR
jgi:hypothetical protein